MASSGLSRTGLSSPTVLLVSKRSVSASIRSCTVTTTRRSHHVTKLVALSSCKDCSVSASIHPRTSAVFCLHVLDIFGFKQASGIFATYSQSIVTFVS